MRGEGGGVGCMVSECLVDELTTHHTYHPLFFGLSENSMR